MNELIAYVITFVLQIGAFFFLLRFLLQVCRADFYNPISQGIVTITDPVLRPLHVVIPSYRNLDFAAFLMTWVCKALIVFTYVALYDDYASVLQIIATGLRDALTMVVYVYIGCLIIIVIVSFVAPGSYHPALVLVQQIAEPLLAPARKLIPPIGGIDLSVLLVFLVLGLVLRMIPLVFQALFA